MATYNQNNLMLDGEFVEDQLSDAELNQIVGGENGGFAHENARLIAAGDLSKGFLDEHHHDYAYRALSKPDTRRGNYF